MNEFHSESAFISPIKKLSLGNFPERSVKGGGAAAARAVHSNALLPALLEKKKENIQVE